MVICPIFQHHSILFSPQILSTFALAFPPNGPTRAGKEYVHPFYPPISVVFLYGSVNDLMIFHKAEPDWQSARRSLC